MAQPATLPDLLRQAAAAGPGRVAVTVDGGAVLTYGSWHRRSDAMARGLQGGGVRPGDRVALLFDAVRWAEYAVAYLAVHKAAAVAVPLGADLTAMELARILGDCQASVIVAPPDLASRGTAVPVTHPGELEHQGLDRPVASAVHPSVPGEVLYASRPLSRPVPIARSHHALLAGPAFMFGPGASADSLLHAFPVGSVAGQDALCACLQPTPVRCLVLPAFDPDRFCALVSAGPSPACMLHPAAAQALLDSGATARHDLSGVSRLILA
ncbi:MAG: AMP-binding protein, partial [Actinomycetota bacterium]|nr:AMP-binding protein [Actinomycetota bacterium]